MIHWLLIDKDGGLRAFFFHLPESYHRLAVVFIRLPDDFYACGCLQNIFTPLPVLPFLIQNFFMRFLQTLFGTKKTVQAPTLSREENTKRIQANTGKLWAFIKETMEWYHSQSCACAFPRYRQMVGIDCMDYRKAFYVSETEGFITASLPYFNQQQAGPANANVQLWTCKKCGSVYNWMWEDFSIHVNRAVLKLRELKVEEKGAATQLPIPLFVGLFGHGYPDKSLIQPVAFETFSAYMRELKS